MSQPETTPGPTAKAVIVDRLRAEILGGTHEPGSPLREETLASRFEASRHTVRAALAMLRAERLVESAPYRGVWVTELDDAALEALQDLRCALESAAVRLSHQRHGGNWSQQTLAPIETALDALETAELAGVEARVNQAHVAFHRAVVAASGSARIIEQYEQIGSELLLLTAHVRPHYPAGSLGRQHRDYLADIQRGDQDAVWRHLTGSTDLIRSARRRGASTSGPEPR